MTQEIATDSQFVLAFVVFKFFQGNVKIRKCCISEMLTEIVKSLRNVSTKEEIADDEAKEKAIPRPPRSGHVLDGPTLVHRQHGGGLEVAPSGGRKRRAVAGREARLVRPTDYLNRVLADMWVICMCRWTQRNEREARGPHWRESTLFFGLSRQSANGTGGDEINDADFYRFVSDVVTPLFRDGLTILDADGFVLWQALMASLPT